MGAADAHNASAVAIGDFDKVGATIPRVSATGDSGGAYLSSGRLTLCGLYIPGGVTINKIGFFSGATALATGTNRWHALYSQARALLAVTGDQVNTPWAANAEMELALSPTYTTTESGFYYVGVMVKATTVPSLIVSGSAMSTLVAGLSPIKAGHSTTGLTDSASAPATAAALTATTTVPLAYVSVA